MVTFFVAEGSLQSIIISHVYLLSMAFFARVKPMRSRGGNRLGIMNDLLLHVTVCHIFYYTALFGEEMKYEVGKSMLGCIYVFIAINTLYFFTAKLPSLKIMALSNLSEENRVDLLICLKYT